MLKFKKKKLKLNGGKYKKTIKNALKINRKFRKGYIYYYRKL